MRDGTVAEHAVLAGRWLARRARGALARALAPARSVEGSRAPTRLLIATQDIRTADPTVAADIYAGYYVFDGVAVNAHGRSPFELPPPSPAWAENLASFGWLRHLRAADTALARANARALVDDWMSLAGKPAPGPAWRPKVVARRMLAWLSQSPLILQGADAVFYRRFMRSLGRQTAFLRTALDAGLTGEARLFAAIALSEASLCAEGFERYERVASRRLAAEVGRQILPDGGHVGRNPGVLVELLLDLLPVRQAYAARGASVPPALLNAIDRMMPMIRAFRHGDGALALFNGMGVTRPDVLATVLAYDDARGQPLRNAPYSGYQRLEGGAAVAVMDTGPPPPPDFSHEAHAGTLAFEFSSGAQRIVVNCGCPPASQAGAREAARATAAHSTLVLDDRSSSRFASSTRLGRWLGGALLPGPVAVPVERAETADETAVEASHDGYLRRQGIVHHRRLALSRSGERLRGHDRLERRGEARAAPFAIRFHLHPAARTSPIRGGSAVLIALPSGEQWVFEAGGLAVAVEDSIFFAAPEGPRKIEQLVLRADTAAAPEATWSFTWLEGTGRPGARGP